MKKIALTQGKFAKVDDEDYDWLNQWKWHAQRSGNTFYAQRAIIWVNKKYKCIIMQRVIMNCPDGMYVDHIDGDGLNNQKNNLRICTKKENARNRKLNKNSSSGYKGAYWNKRDEKWYCQIRVNEITLHVGIFETAIEAAKAYNRAAKKYFGKFARLNRIPKKIMEQNR